MDANSSAALFLWGEPAPVSPWVLALPLLAAMAAACAPARAHTPLVWTTAATTVVAGSFAQGGSSARILYGLFTVTPLLLVGLAHARARLLWTFAATFVGQVALIHRGGLGGGLQVGAHMLLPAVPALLALVAREMVAAESRVSWILAAVLVGLSLRGQVVATLQAVAITAESAAADDADAARGVGPTVPSASGFGEARVWAWGALRTHRITTVDILYVHWNWKETR